MDKDLVLLERLCKAFGPSGCENGVADIIRQEISGLADDISFDRGGNLIALYKGKNSSKRLMVSAHMDEVGFIVTHIDDDGYIRFSNVGGIDPRVIGGRKVSFGDEGHQISGIVGMKPIHLSGGNDAPSVDSLYVDCGAKSKDEMLKYVQPGDFGTFDGEFVRFGDNMLRSKAIDDRLGCAVMINTLKALNESGLRPDLDIYFAFTTREEIGKSGARTAAFHIAPDFGIVLEATAVADICDVPPISNVAKTGEGGVISLLDNGTIYNMDFVRFALDTGRKRDIKCQVKRFVSGGNDAAQIQKTGRGAKVLAISTPTRYIHTPSNVINIDDYFSVQKLLYALIEESEVLKNV